MIESKFPNDPASKEINRQRAWPPNYGGYIWSEEDNARLCTVRLVLLRSLNAFPIFGTGKEAFINAWV